MNFQKEIINWYHIHKRDLPWRHTQDPYVIWLSEIILQQTRVEQGLPYFNRFLEHYPTVSHFAAATEAQVLKLWQGLGYYSRGRNMLHTALQIQDLHQGVFPVRYDDLIQLKGIGEYTAAAISSFSSGEARAVLDGNVFRVLSRYYGIDTPINSTEGKKQFSELAQSMMEGQDPMVYNQAIMEFGALQCKPKSPDCGKCPLQPGCYSYQYKTTGVLPVKLKKLVKKTRFFNYLVVRDGDQILMKRRNPGDIWQHLYDFPLIETEGMTDIFDRSVYETIKEQYGQDTDIVPLTNLKHILTHQIIYVQFFGLDNYIINFNHSTDIKWVSLADLDHLPQPKIITDFINAYLTK